MADIYRIGRTKVRSIPSANGYRTLDLRPFMREDISEHMRKVADLPKEIIRAVDRKPGIVDFPMERIKKMGGSSISELPMPWKKVLDIAWEHQYIDSYTGKLADNSFDYDQYHRRLALFWYAGYIKIDISLYPIERGERRIDFYEESIRFKFMEVNCKKGLLESMFKPRERIIWTGYYGNDNNLWQIFSGQFDDSNDPIKSLTINPSGSFALEYAKRRYFSTDESIIEPAIIGAICHNTPFLTYRIR